ncbi:hypothetical protein F4805DRAFT_19662 [Annulohypoxylon moriforme]|nr:hypothetical protein F4805DRAFT_19662 [Annulohypoxylon moriforme]
MEHLTLPDTPRHPTFEIRLVEGVGYDEGDLATYPDRQGWGKRPILEWIEIFQKQPSSFTAFLERWLLFGQLFAVCGTYGVRFRSSDFIRFVGDARCPMFTTRYFPELLQRMKDNDISSNSSLTKEDMTSMLDMLGSHADCVLLHVQLSSNAGDCTVEDEAFPDNESIFSSLSLSEFIRTYGTSVKDPRGPDIIFATSIIIESLIGMTMGVLDELPLGNMNSINGDGLMWTKMREDGWCPAELSRFFKQFNTSLLYYMYNLDRPGPHEKHQVIRVRKIEKPGVISSTSPSSARLCTPYTCAHRQLRDAEYRTKHTDSCTGCDEVVADPKELCAILGQGEIPLILSIDERDNDSKIRFIRAKPWVGNLRYVAISHVWSDGLGNLEQNAIPRCQLLRLSSFVRNLPGAHAGILLFWFDTICVPPDLADMPETQRLALGQMRNTYVSAEVVLVLDSWLYNSTMRDKTHIESLLKIFGCTWNTRLWAYQEGVLAKSLQFQFLDGTYDLDAGIREIARSTSVITALNIVAPLRVRYHSLRGFREHGSREGKLAVISSELAYRSTSVAEDEPLCLAVLLDLDVEEMTRTEPHLRMERFWRMLPAVPRSLAFASLNSLMEVDGLHWAPKTFLKSPLNDSKYGTPHGLEFGWKETPARLTQRGMRLDDVGISFLHKTKHFASSFYLRDQYSGWHRVELGNEGIDLSLDDVDHAGQVKASGHQDMAIILDTGAGCSNSWDLAERTNHNLYHGVLVVVDEEKNDIIFCQRVQECTLRKLGTQPQDKDSAVERLNGGFQRGLECTIGINPDGDLIGYMDAILHIPKRQWCIG